MNSCRCGWRDGRGVHLCHFDRNGDRCQKPGETKYFLGFSSLAGAQMKFGAESYHYCPEHWAMAEKIMGEE